MNPRGIVVDEIEVPVFVINLDSRPDRWAGVQQRLVRHHISPERVSGLTGEAARRLGHRVLVPDRQLAEWRVDQAALGCAASHLELYRRIANDGLTGALIMEDDVVPATDFTARAARALQRRSPDSDLVSLGWLFYRPGLKGRSADLAHRLSGRGRRDRLTVAPFGFGTHCYWVSQRFCSSAAELLSPVFAPIDAMLRAVTHYSSWQSEVHWPPLAAQDDSASDVQVRDEHGAPSQAGDGDRR